MLVPDRRNVRARSLTNRGDGSSDDEADRQLAGDVARRRRVVGEIAQVLAGHLAAVGAAVRRREAEHLHPAGRVDRRVVVGLPGVPGIDGVAGEDPRRCLDHVLGVARRASDGVQLEQLAALVLVREVLGRLVVAQVEQHRRVQAGGDEQVVEVARGTACAASGRSRCATTRRCRGSTARGSGWTRSRSSPRAADATSGSAAAGSSSPGRRRSPTDPCGRRRRRPTSCSALLQPVGIPGVELVALAVADLARPQLILEPLVGPTGAPHVGQRAAVVSPGEPVHHQPGSGRRHLGPPVGPDLRVADGARPPTSPDRLARAACRDAAWSSGEISSARFGGGGGAGA